MVGIIAYTGLRSSEVAGLETADLTFDPVSAGSAVKCSVRVE